MRVLSTFAALALTAGTAFADETVAQGQAVYETWCVICHGAGDLYLGTVALGMIREGKPAALAERTDLQPAYIDYVVRNGMSIMPFFRTAEIDAEDMAALVAYLTRNNAQ